MSLVVCSNQDTDATTTTNAQNIYKPFSFRNALSSTYVVPKNAQVALQSCKYNLDGTVPLSGADHTLYQYYGQEIIDVEKFGDEGIDELSTSVPIRTPVFDSGTESIVEVNADDLATKLQKSLNDNIFHPNLRGGVRASVKRDATTNEFQGYDITYLLFTDADNVVPADECVINQVDDVVTEAGEEYSYFTYESGEFTSKDNPALGDDGGPAVGVLAGQALSAYNGSMVVDFVDPNSDEVEWGVGLSRICERDNGAAGGLFTRCPEYWRNATGTGFGDTQPTDVFFFDYMVCRKGDTLKLYHTCADSSVGRGNVIMPREVDVSGGAVGADYNLDENSSEFTKVKYELIGQRLKISMLNAAEAETTLYEYNGGDDISTELSCVHQARWNLYPCLYLPAVASGDVGYTLTVEQFTPTPGQLDAEGNFGPTAKELMIADRSEEISWYNSIEITSFSGTARALEIRDWNDVGFDGAWGDFVTWAGIEEPPNADIQLENVLIMKPSSLFSQSIGANTEKLLGFSTPTKAYSYGDGDTLPATARTFSSTFVPAMLASRSMFLRLENMTQQSVNARMGNRSSIIAHLPRFDGAVETGRIYHEPKNLIFLDLNNAQPMPVTSFDISFVYSNEQYVRALTGQSVVCLYFREKPSEKIQQV